jgi:2-aminoadipate transaminase
MEIRLSAWGQASSEPAPVNAMMAAFAADFRDGIDINLGVGYVNEKTIPEPLLLEAMQAVMADSATYRQAFNYGGPAGSANLVAAIRRFYIRNRIGHLDESTLADREIIIGASGATSLLDAIAECLSPGIVVTSDPMYYIYTNALLRKGFEILAVPEDAEGLDPDRLEAALAQLGDRAAHITFFYLVTVNNPACSILSDARRARLVEIAARLSRQQNRRIPVFFDTAYELLIHDPAVPKPYSGLHFDDAGIVYELGTLSKVLAPALRTGFLIGPPGPFMNAMIQKTSDTGFSAPLFTQEMGAWILDNHIAAQIEKVNSGYREKARKVRESIDADLGSLLADCRGGSAGFYYYLTFRDIRTDTASPFFQRLTRTTGDPAIDGPPDARRPRVIYIPGEYCVHPGGDLVEAGRRQLRLSYGFEETPAIRKAIAHMRAASEKAG